MGSHSECYDNLKALIKENKFKELESFVTDKGASAVTKEVKVALRKPDGVTIISGLLKALQGVTRESLECRVKVFECVLEYCRVQSGSGGAVSFGASNNDLLGGLIGVLLLHIDAFPSHVLVSIVDKYLEYVKSVKPLQGRWVELFPKLLSTLSGRDDISVDSRVMTGEDYRYHVLKTLIDYKWSDETASTLLTALKDIDLEKEELNDLVMKVERHLKSVDYPSVPPIVYHLVLIAQSKLPGTALTTVVSYFNAQEEKLKEREQQDEEASSSRAIDDIDSAEIHAEASEISRDRRELREAQGTVILHLTHLAQFDPTIAKDYIKLLKSSIWLPHIFCSPFNLPLSLSLASIERYEEQILEAVRNCILYTLQQQHRSKYSAWLRSCWQQTAVDLHGILRTVITNCTVGWEQVSDGLCRIFLSLLEGGASQMRTDASSLAVTLLPLLVSRHHRLATHCIKHISSNALTSTNTKHYIEVLGKFSRTTPLLLMEHHSVVREVVVEQLQHLSTSSSTHLLHAISNSLRIDVPLRDALVIALRKMLFSRSVECRVVAVRGLLLLLKQLKVSSCLPASQASSSFSSSLSQISCTAQVHSNASSTRNHALCYELLGILRRCFSQQYQVRSALYDGVYDVCRYNPKLCPNILSALHQHLIGFVDLRPDTVNPIILRKVVSFHTDTVTLVEPLGNVLSSLASCKTYYERKRSEQNGADFTDDDDDEEESAVTVLNDVCVLFDVLSEKLSACDLDDLDLDESLEFTKATPAGHKNVLNAMVMVGVYDALMQHSFYLKTKDENDKLVIRLFKMRQKIVELVNTKTGKAQKKNAKNKDKPSVKSTEVSFNCSLRLSVISDMLGVTFKSKDSDDEENSTENIFHECYDFQIFLLTCIEQYISSHKDLLPFEREHNLPYLRTIARLLFVECCENIGLGESDDERTVQRLRQCLSILNNLIIIFSKFHKEKIENILKEVTNKSASKDLDALSYIIFKSLQKVIVRIINHEEKTPLMKDATTIVQIMSQVAHFMSPESEELQKSSDWVVDLAKLSIDNSALCEELLKLMLFLSGQLKGNCNLTHQIAKDVYHCLGDNDPEESMDEESTITYEIVNEDTVYGIITVLVNYIDESLTFVEMSLKKHRAFLVTSAEHSASDKVESNINVKLGTIIRTFYEIVNSRLKNGPVMDLIIKKADKLYSVLALFLRYYLDMFRLKRHPKISEKFERLINMSYEQLSEPLYRFLNYIEDVRNIKNKKGTSFQTACKETKLIPALVFAIEKYDKLIIQLSKKSKVDLQKNMKLSTLRDFKIDSSKLAENDEPEATSTQTSKKRKNEASPSSKKSKMAKT